MQRRRLLVTAGALAASAPLARPGLGRAESAAAGRVLRFAPIADLGVLDPVVTTTYVTRNHACLPYVPLGQFFQPTAYRRSITGLLKGPTVFWNIRPAG